MKTYYTGCFSDELKSNLTLGLNLDSKDYIYLTDKLEFASRYIIKSFALKKIPVLLKIELDENIVVKNDSIEVEEGVKQIIYENEIKATAISGVLFLTSDLEKVSKKEIKNDIVVYLYLTRMEQDLFNFTGQEIPCIRLYEINPIQVIKSIMKGM